MFQNALESMLWTQNTRPRYTLQTRYLGDRYLIVLDLVLVDKHDSLHQTGLSSDLEGYALLVSSKGWPFVTLKRTMIFEFLKTVQHSRAMCFLLARHQILGLLQVILDKKAQIAIVINPKIGHGQTPLSFAVKEGHEAVVRVLLERGADIDLRDNDGWRPRGGSCGY